MERPTRVVVALGGNAFASPSGRLTMEGQFRFARRAMADLEPLVAAETQLVITHGNGPQVGHMLARVEDSLGDAYPIPLEVCVAESEGELGYVLQQTLHNALVDEGIDRPVVSLLTQVVVDEHDAAFATPTKPIGPFLDEAQARRLREQGLGVQRDPAGRGFRRVVPSPEPLEIVEATVVSRLLEQGVTVVAAGGGGVPVLRREGRLSGVPAVVDKDLASALLGDSVGAEVLVMLTDVPCAYLSFRSDRQQPIKDATPQRVLHWLSEGEFAPGSMGPKMQAAARFAATPGRRAVVCDPASLRAALDGRAGTIVTREGSS